jgi:hypothetical protein
MQRFVSCAITVAMAVATTTVILKPSRAGALPGSASMLAGAAPHNVVTVRHRHGSVVVPRSARRPIGGAFATQYYFPPPSDYAPYPAYPYYYPPYYAPALYPGNRYDDRHHHHDYY